MGERYGVDPAKLQETLVKVVFPPGENITQEEFIAFLIVANQYNLNPFTKEIYAFKSNNRIIPIVPVDGWITIINRSPELDGVEFEDIFLLDAKDGKESRTLDAIKCRIRRKDRAAPIEVTEYMEECRMPNREPWKKWPRRMLRHKALIQCARVAFSLSGIYDPDEAARIIEADSITPLQQSNPLPAEIKRASEVNSIEAGPRPSPEELAERLTNTREYMKLLEELETLRGPQAINGIQTIDGLPIEKQRQVLDSLRTVVAEAQPRTNGRMFE